MRPAKDWTKCVFTNPAGGTGEAPMPFMASQRAQNCTAQHSGLTGGASRINSPHQGEFIDAQESQAIYRAG